MQMTSFFLETIATNNLSAAKLLAFLQLIIQCTIKWCYKLKLKLLLKSLFYKRYGSWHFYKLELPFIWWKSKTISIYKVL